MVKRASAEVADGPRVEVISDFIERELEAMAAGAPALPAGSGSADALDAMFRRMLAEHAPA